MDINERTMADGPAGITTTSMDIHRYMLGNMNIYWVYLLGVVDICWIYILEYLYMCWVYVEARRKTPL